MILTSSIIAVTDFRKHPFMNDGDSITAIMKNNKPAYYAVSPEKMKYLIECEKQLKYVNDLNEYESIHEG